MASHVPETGMLLTMTYPAAALGSAQLVTDFANITSQCYGII